MHIFTTYCIPYLQFYVILVNLDRLRTKLHTDGDLMLIPIALIGILEEEARFSDACVRALLPESPMMMYLNRKEYDIVSESLPDINYLYYK